MPACHQGCGCSHEPAPGPTGLVGLVRALHFIPRAGDPASYRDKTLFATLEVSSRCWVEGVWREGESRLPQPRVSQLGDDGGIEGDPDRAQGQR